MEESKVLLSNEFMEIRAESTWPNECDQCRARSAFTIVFKNNEFGYNKKIILCKEHYEEFIKTILNTMNKN